MFAQLMDQVKNNAGIDVVNDMVYKALGAVLKINNDSTKNNTERVNVPHLKALPESALVNQRSTEVDHCSVVTTGVVDNRSKHKRAIPRGSPSKYKK